MKSLKIIKNIYSILSIGVLFVGLILLIWPGVSLDIMCKIFGILLIAYGIVKLLGYFAKDVFQLAFQFDLALGIVSIVIGCVMAYKTKDLVTVLAACIGIFMIIDAALKIQTASDAKKFGMENWWIILIIAVVAAILGILLLILPLKATNLLMRIIGLNLILDGILNFWVVQNTVKIFHTMS